MFTNYYSISPGMLSQIPGKGAFYVIAFTDSDGVPIDWRNELQTEPAEGHAGRELLVSDTL